MFGKKKCAEPLISLREKQILRDLLQDKIDTYTHTMTEALLRRKELEANITLTTAGWRDRDNEVKNIRHTLNELHLLVSKFPNTATEWVW